MPAARKPLSATLWVVLAVALSALARTVGGERFDLPGEEGGASHWVSLDPDSLYHVRRIDRALAAESVAPRVAETDRYLNFPEGAAIPWPPYYTLLASTLLAPFAPREAEEPGAAEARRRWVERATASLPRLFGVLTTLLLAWVGYRLAGAAGAAAAGLTHAFTGKAIFYGSLGNGDHHAWVSLCLAALGALLSDGLERRVPERPRAALGYGLALGLCAGLVLGTWVGALMYVVLVEALLGLVILLRSRSGAASSGPEAHAATLAPDRGLALLGLAFHGAALVVLLPAVLSSPWAASSPWMVINLSWFHIAFLALGGSVFLPLLVLRRGTRTARAFPALVLIALLAVAGVASLLEGGPAQGLREAFDWAGRGDAFMARVAESDPLFSLGPKRLFRALGFGVVALPVAWLAALVVVARGLRPGLLPWVVWTPPLALQALTQQRFAEPFAIPLAALSGWALGAGLRVAFRSDGPDTSPLRRGLAPLAAALIAIGLQGPTAHRIYGKATGPDSPLAFGRSAEDAARARRPVERPVERLGLRPGVRLLCDWIRRHTPESGDYSVLAFWHWGHVIEWAADRPSVATNFGSYVGADSFLDPSRFFMSDDDREAESLLERRRARYVLVTTHLLNGMKTLIQAVPRDEWSEFVEVGDEGIESLGMQQPRLLFTVGARLSLLEQLADMAAVPPVPFLRLVHVSRVRDARPDMRGSRIGSVWERVPGAWLEVRGEPGTVLEARVRVEYPDAEFQLLWKDSAAADADGVARLRVPYSTDTRAGDGRARGPLRWTFGDGGGSLTVPESAVASGMTLELR